MPSRLATRRTRASIQIAGGDLYAISEKTNLAGLGKVGTGLPTVKATHHPAGRRRTRRPTLPVSDVRFVMLDANSGVAGVDTAYVTVDTDDDGVNDEIRKYTERRDNAGPVNGTKPGDYPFLTGRVSGGEVQLFASKG